MASTILTNWTVYYAGDTGGDKQIKWTGTTGTNTVNELYSAVADLFSIAAQNDANDTIPMEAVTPTLYEIGAFDAGDTEPWFIDSESIKHLTGGGLETTGWTRTVGSNAGIVMVQCQSTGFNMTSSDIGDTCTDDTNSDSGTILHVDTTNYQIWIRPDDSTAANNFDTGSSTISADTSSNTVTYDAAATSGEMIWTNLFTLGTIEEYTTIHIAQNNTVISNTEDSGSGRWWGDDHVDILILTTNQDSLIDRGLLTFYARQYSKRYSYFITDASNGGRIPIPLSTSDDPNNESGYRTFTGSAGSGTFNVGNGIYVGASWGAATARGILTAVGGTTVAPLLTYYLIGDLTNFANGNSVTEYNVNTEADGDASCTAGTPSNTGPASLTLSIAFGLDETLDIDNDTTNEDYSIVINCSTVSSLADMNERLKYITRRGETSTLDGIEGQQYIGIDYRVDYNTLTGTIADGSTVTQTLSDGTTATSEVVAHDTTAGYMMLRDTRGTLEFGTGAANLGIDGSNYVDMTGSTSVEIVAPSVEHPFGLFAGGTFFGARGVALINVPAADATNYQLVDNDGNIINPPNTVPIVVTGVVQNTQCYVADATPTVYLNTTATSNVAGDEYEASTTHTYTIDISVTVRAREMGYLPFETSGTISDTGLTVTAVWQVDPNFKLLVSGETIQFTNATSLITRGTGDFGTDGWLSVMSQVTVEGSANNDGTYTITAISTNTITVSGTLTDEGPSSGITLTYTRRAPTW